MENICQRSYQILRVLYGVVPIVAGADKFLNLLTDWSAYIAPQFTRMIPVSPEVFMAIVGVIEIVAGLIVLSRFAHIGGYVVAAWLVVISVNLIFLGRYDVAVRDLVMAVGAFVLGQLAVVYGPQTAAEHRVPGNLHTRTS